MGARLLAVAGALLLACLSVSGEDEVAPPVLELALEPGEARRVTVKDIEFLMRADAAAGGGRRFFVSFHKRDCPFSQQWMPVYKVVPQAFPTERFAYIEEYGKNFGFLHRLGVMGTPTVLYFRDGKVQTSRMPFVHQPGRLSGTGSIQELAMFVETCTGEHPVGDALPEPEPAPEPMMNPTTRMLVQIAALFIIFEVAQRVIAHYYMGTPWTAMPDFVGFFQGLGRGRAGGAGAGGAQAAGGVGGHAKED